ncbi:MAG: XTP/dITP diphosphatase [Clostridia bacterium]|nr:XTP/dITP diphosphatase [Clostridia bacterium]
MDIVLASRNKKKIAELQSLLSTEALSGLRVLSLDDIGYHEEIEENGTTFEENSQIKASVPASLGYIGVADDSGLEVDYLDGAPGIYSARYSGEGATDAKNNEKLLSLLQDVPAEKRSARFVCVISCVFPDGQKFSVRGECPGRILTSYAGNAGFGYDPLFYYEPMGKTFAELSGEEKNKISHRGRAMELFIQKLSATLSEKKGK